MTARDGASPNHTWESLDAPRYDPEEEDDEEDKTDLVEEFFAHIFELFHI